MKKILITILGLLVISACSGSFVVNTDEESETTEEETTSETETEEADTELEMQTFSDDRFGYQFTYPVKGWMITTEETVQQFPNGKDWYRVEAENRVSTQNPLIRFEINPDGYGLMPSDKEYEVEITEEGEVNIIAVNEIEQNEETEDEIIFIRTNIVEYKGNTYFWYITFKKGETDYEAILKAIIESFVVAEI